MHNLSLAACLRLPALAAWHGLRHPPSSGVWGEAAALLLARKGFGPAGEAGSSSLPRCPGWAPLVASACKKGGGLFRGPWRVRARSHPRHTHGAQSNPPGFLSITGGERIHFCTTKHFRELFACNYRHGARPCRAWRCTNSEAFLED